MIADPHLEDAVRARVRVIVYSPDDEVAAEATTALARNGMSSLAVREQASMLQALGTYGAHVAIIDARGSITRAVRVVGPIRAQHPRVRVILVDSPQGIPGDGALTIARGSLGDRLASTVLDAYLHGYGLRDPGFETADVEPTGPVYLDLR